MCPTPPDSIKQRRSNIRRSICRIVTAVAKAEKSEKPQVVLMSSELTCRPIEANFKQIMAIQTEIEALYPTEEQLEDLSIAVKVTIKDQLGDDVQDTRLKPGLNSVKLPTLALPTIAGISKLYHYIPASGRPAGIAIID